jgi:AAA domain, putative AbiEii toxin, Type IV TA system/AAA domain
LAAQIWLALQYQFEESAPVLEELSISRFKSIKEQRLQFGRVNLFIGGNGTGKSNLLEAIGLTAACLGRGLGDSDIGQKGLRITPPELMKSSFKNDELPKTLALEAIFSGQVQYSATLQSRERDPLLRFFAELSKVNGSKVFGRSNRGASAIGAPYADRLEQNRGMWDQTKATLDVPPTLTKEFAEFSRYVIYTPQTDFLRGRQTGRIDTPPIGLHGEGLPEAVSSFLSEWRRANPKLSKVEPTFEWDILESCAKLVWLPGWASSFGTHRAKAAFTSRDLADRGSKSVYFTDQFMHASRNQLSVYDSSEGTLFLLFAAIVLAHPDAPKTFALDNVDSGLNPKLTRHLIEHIIGICKKTASSDSKVGAHQVFLTSHNPTALDAIDLFDNDQKVFVVQRNNRGHTTATPLRPTEGMSRKDWDLAKGGRNLSQLWLDGDIPGALGKL